MTKPATPTVERIRELFSYDTNKGELIRRISRGSAMKGDIAGCISTQRSCGQYIVVSIDDRMYQAHRVIWALVYGNWPEKEIDHIDGNGLNNKIDNLREATRQENVHNRGAPRTNTSGFKGVYWSAKHNKWRARIRINGKKISLGYFADIQDANAAYVSAAKQLHGDFHFTGFARWGDFA